MSDEPAVRIVVYEHDHTKRQPIPELQDLWDRFQAVIFEQTDLNNQGEAFRNQQLAILRDGCLRMASPFADATDESRQSYFCRQNFFYRFAGAEEYFWVTSVPEQLLAAMYFPARNIAVSLYPGVLDPGLLREFERLRATVPKADGATRARAQCALVLGFPQFMHTLWNHLPGLEGALQAGLAQNLPLAVTHEPFGPTEAIFPELAAGVRRLPFSEVPELNREHAFLVGLGSRKIPPSLQARVRKAARRQASPAAIADRERFRAAHAPVFWMSLKPPDRTCHNQVEALATIVEAIWTSYPQAGFLLDGASLPWDFADNPNYSGFFRDYIGRERDVAARLIDELLSRFAQHRRGALNALSGISACDELAWAEIADFYFCQGGTPQHKIAWIHETPGMVYSNSKYIAHYRWMAPLLRHPPIYYLPANLVRDDPDEGYTPDKLARKDQNFTIVSPPEAAQRLLDAYRDSRRSAAPTGAANPAAAAAAHAAENPMPDKTAPGSTENPPAPGNAPAAPADFFRLPEHKGLPFQEVVALLHRHLRPRSYLEIGAHACGTLAAANCASVAIDRGFVLDNGVLGEKPSCCFFRMAADDFFDAYDPKAMLNGPVEVALLHGTPLFEVALRAFMNIERHCKRNSVVLVPGCIPTDAYVARRELADDRLAPYSPHRDWWAGDLWKFAVILKKVRADLRVRAFNAAPAGLIAITALDPASEVLENNYFGVAEQFRSALLNQRGAETYLQSLGVARTDVFQNAEALSALFWL